METERIFGHHEGCDGHHPFREKIPGNPGGGHIAAHWAWLALPGGVSVVGDEDRDIFFIVEIEDRDKDMSGFDHLEIDFEFDRFADIESIGDVPYLRLHPHGPQAHHLIARGLCRIRPFDGRLDVAGMQIVVDHLMCRPRLHHLPLVQ